MARHCLVCGSSNQAAIDAALIDPHCSFRAIASQFGVTTMSLQRHRNHHLVEAVRQNREMYAMLTSTNLLNKLSSLDETTMELLAEARQAGDLRTALAAIRESRGNVESYARIGVWGEVEARLSSLEAQSRPTPPTDAGIEAGAATEAATGAEDR